MVEDSSTEHKIVEAARRVFMQKGMAAARMQEIADEAGINKALLHYYFRSKDKLFEYILRGVIDRIAGGVQEMFERDMTVRERLLFLVEVYMDTLLENRYLPYFMLDEINHNPDRIAALLREKIAIHLSGFLHQVQDEAQKGWIRPIHPLHLILNVMGMVIFPFAVYPVISKVSGEDEEGMIKNFLEERKVVIQEFIVNAITP